MESYLLKDTDKLLRDLDSIDIDKDNNKYSTLIFDFENLSKILDCQKVMNIIDKYKPENIVIKNSRVENIANMYKDEDLKLNELFISDELYSMSGNLDILFPRFKAKKLTLKKFKINSKFQLNKFFEFIEKVGCEELILEDIFIELLIKENKEDETFDELQSYFSFENGNILFFKNEEKIKTKIKKLKLIDCPLFAITEEIKAFNDILVDIDENSLLNPSSIITKFKIEEGYTYMYYDLDSYKYNENDEDDYLDNLNYIFNHIIDGYNNYKKISFKNFDTTKYEYITGENLTFVDEKKWVLNDQEKKRKNKFEEFDKTINELINKNINKLSNVKELIFDNCTNHFIELILKFINSSKNDLDLLKIKKCGQEYFDLKNILSLNIKNLILFDTPLIIDRLNKEKTSTNLERFNGKLGKIENLTIKTCSLEHYCLDNNLDYYNTIEIIIELINNENIGKNLCFEMNTLPIIMTYLIAKGYHNKFYKQEEFKIPQYFEFSEPIDLIDKNIYNINNDKIKKGIELRNNLFENNCKLEKLKGKTIILKKNNIKNRLENYEELMSLYIKLKLDFIRGKDEKTDFGSDVFNLDIDYKNFFKINDIDIVTLKNCLFSCYSNQRINENEIEETFVNFVKDDKRSYKLDIKTLNEIIYKNKSFDGISSLFKFFSLENKQVITSDTLEYLKSLNVFFINLRNIFDYLRKYIKETTLIFYDIKEIKEFYCLMCIVRLIQNKNNFENLEFIYHERPIKFMFPKKSVIMEKIKPYYLETKNENDINVLSVFNYYYRSDEEKEIFGDYKMKKIIIDDYIFGTEYEFN